MNIGDRVRLLHGHEEGRIVKILENGLIEIEIEDGFQIPVMKKEVVLIAREEADYFNKPESDQGTPIIKQKQVNQSEKGVFLSYIPVNDKVLACHIINTKEETLLFSLSEQHGNDLKHLSAAELKPNKSLKIAEFTVASFDQWPSLHFEALFFKTGFYTKRLPFIKDIKFKASAFFKSQKLTPLLNQKGYVYQLDANISSVDTAALKEALTEKNIPEQANPSFVRPAKEIDLHIEVLTDQYEQMSNAEKIQLQLKTFEQQLNYAIASGMDEITFIHGVGNGVLRKEIHKILSQNNNLKFFQDTQKSNFGYGATLVKIK